MLLSEALEDRRKGLFFRRSSWKKDSYLFLDDKGRLRCTNQSIYPMSVGWIPDTSKYLNRLNDIEAKDWEIYIEPFL